MESEEQLSFHIKSKKAGWDLSLNCPFASFPNLETPDPAMLYEFLYVDMRGIESRNTKHSQKDIMILILMPRFG